MLVVKIWCRYIFSQYHFIIFLFPSSNNLKLYKSTVIKCIWWRLVPNKVLIFYKLKFSLFKKNTCEIVQSRDLNFGTLHDNKSEIIKKYRTLNLCRSIHFWAKIQHFNQKCNGKFLKKYYLYSMNCRACKTKQLKCRVPTSLD